MLNLEISSAKLKVICTSIHLFNSNGFHNTGMNLLIKQANIQKATLYSYFQSKERLIEMCIAFQTKLLKEAVLAIIYSSHYRTPIDKLKEIVILHADIKSLYHLILKAIFEVKIIYPEAYNMAVEYRKWLLHEISELIFSLETHALKPDASMVLNLIDGLLLQLLDSNNLDDRDKVVERFFGGVSL